MYLGGLFFGRPFSDYYMKDLFLVGDAIALLYRNFPQVPWVTLFLMTCNFASTVAILYAVVRFAEFMGWKFQTILLAAAPLLLLLNWQQTTLDFTRAPFLLCVAAISLSFLQFAGGKRSLLLAMSLSFWVLGLLIRPEIALATLVLSAPALCFFHGKKLKQLITHATPFGLCVALYGAVFLYKLEYSPLFYYQIEPDFEYELMDRNNIVPLSEMKTRKDSVRYQAIAHYWMLADSIQTPPQFIRSLINKKTSIYARYVLLGDKIGLRNMQANFTRVAGNVQFWFLLLCAFSMAVCVGKRKSIMRLVSMVAWCVLIIVFVIGNMSSEMQPRLYEPAVYVTASLLFFAAMPRQSYGTPLGLASKLTLVTCNAVLMTYALVFYHNESKTNALHIASNKAFLDKVNALPQYQYVFYAGGADLFNYTDNVFRNDKMFGNKTVLTAGFVQYSYTRQFKNILQENTACSVYEFSCLFEFLKRNKTQTIIVGSERMVTFYQYYLKQMYDLDFKYAPTGIVHQNEMYAAYLIG